MVVAGVVAAAAGEASPHTAGGSRFAAVPAAVVVREALRRVRLSVLSPLVARTMEGELQPAKRAVRALHECLHQHLTALDNAAPAAPPPPASQKQPANSTGTAEPAWL